MDTKKHADTAVLIYLFLLLALVVFNIITKANFLDFIYLVVVVSCVLKYFIIINGRRKKK